MHPCELAAKAANVDIAPTSNSTESFQCNLCGHCFESGGYPYKPSAKFNNHADTFGTQTICRFCKTVTTGSTFILTHKCAVYSPEGVRSLNKDIDLASFIRKPPKGPLVVVYGTIKQQHLVWRTPLSHSNDLFQFRYGDSLCVVDRQAVLDTVTLYMDALALINEELLSAGLIKKNLPSFFAAPTSGIRSANNPDALMLHHTVKRALQMPGLLNEPAYNALTKAVDAVYDLNYGELFFLIATAKYDDAAVTEHLNS